MAELVWDAVGSRNYETGVDRGVLFVGVNPGVPWNGLRVVTETPKIGNPREVYIDGVKVVHVATADELEMTIEAYSAPAEFAPCEGLASSSLHGLVVTQQRRQSFGFSYRTISGNDIDGNDHGYKIHIVYNALAAPSAKVMTTLSDTPTPTIFTWNLTVRPPIVNGVRGTAHYVIDSKTTPPELLTILEGQIYGTGISDPMLPAAQDLYTMFATYGEVINT